MFTFSHLKNMPVPIFKGVKVRVITPPETKQKSVKKL
jgi:hypothetical protein